MLEVRGLARIWRVHRQEIHTAGYSEITFGLVECVMFELVGIWQINQLHVDKLICVYNSVFDF